MTAANSPASGDDGVELADDRVGRGELPEIAVGPGDGRDVGPAQLLVDPHHAGHGLGIALGDAATRLAMRGGWA